MSLTRHALDAMNNEVPPVLMEHVCDALEEPDVDRRQGNRRREARKWFGRRDLIVRYEEYEDEIEVVTVSCSRTRRRP